MDFDERRRDEVIRYATERYGSDHVAQIVTFQTIKGKQGIRDAARVLGFPPRRRATALCKMYPPAIMGRDEPIDRALRDQPRAPGGLRARAGGARDRRHGARARGPAPRGFRARGRRRDRRRAPRRVPAARSSRRTRATTSKKMVTQFDMNGVAQLGLLKMDFLGLRNLSVIEETVAAPAQPRRRARHRPRAARRRRDLRDAAAGRDHRRVPDGVAGRAQPDQAARARPLRGPDGAASRSTARDR